MTHQLRVKEEMKTNDYKDGNEKITLKYSGLFGSNDRKRRTRTFIWKCFEPFALGISLKY